MVFGPTPRQRRALALASTALFISACSTPAPPAPPPSEVRVVTVAAQPVVNLIELPGRLQAVRTAIFNRGRLRGNRRVAEARQDIAVAAYERSVQGAFQEVSDALAGRRYLADQVSAQERGTVAQRQIAELARTRYREGVVGYIEVLDAERNLFAAEQTLLQLRREEADNLVGLYVALGGGVIETR